MGSLELSKYTVNVTDRGIFSNMYFKVFRYYNILQTFKNASFKYVSH